MGLQSGDAWGFVHGELAVRQRLVVSRAQLLALGIGRRQIQRALDDGRLHTVFWGVYALVPVAALPPLSLEQAAILACGDHAMLSHGSAAKLHGLSLSFDCQIDVTVLGGSERGRHRTGVTIHRVSRLHRHDHHRLHRLPVTGLPRTLIDIAPGLHDRALETAVDETLRRTSLTKLRAALDRHPGRAGTPRLRALLATDRPSTVTRSKAEETLLALIRRSGLPVPESDVAIARYIPDLLWREQEVIVEFDSWEYHSGRAHFTHDRTRHNHLTAAGYTVLHVTWRQLIERPEQVLVWIATAVARR